MGFGDEDWLALIGIEEYGLEIEDEEMDFIVVVEILVNADEIVVVEGRATNTPPE